MVFQRREVGRVGLGFGSRRHRNPSFRAEDSFFPSPYVFKIYFAQAGTGDGQKGAVGTECHPEGKMKDKR